jgi:hypothetical protein
MMSIINLCHRNDLVVLVDVLLSALLLVACCAAASTYPILASRHGGYLRYCDIIAMGFFIPEC